MPTKIEWATETWNVAPGCSPVSEGCQHCCALRDVNRMSRHPNPKISGPLVKLVEKRHGRPEWTGAVTYRYDLLEKPLHWRKPRRVFVNYLGDLFRITWWPFLDEAFAVMMAGDGTIPRSGLWDDNHMFYLLTKHPDHALRYLTNDNTRPRVLNVCQARYGVTWFEWPLIRVCMGITAETQARFDERWAHLRRIPAAKYLVSHEPALGPITYPDDFLSLGSKAGVITGGETGRHARPMHPDWPRHDRDQCRDAGVKFFFKQWGEWGDDERGGIFSVRVGKKIAGRLLDGRTWEEMP